MNQEYLHRAQDEISKAYDEANMIEDEEVRDRIKTGLDNVTVSLMAAEYDEEVGLFEKGDALDYGAVGIMELASAYEDSRELIESGSYLALAASATPQEIKEVVANAIDNPELYDSEALEMVDRSIGELQELEDTLEEGSKLLRDSIIAQEAIESAAQTFVNSASYMTDKDDALKRRINSKEHLGDALRLSASILEDR